MKHSRLALKKGIITPLFALSIVAVFSMIALAVDLGNAYLNKTRLQNLVDSLALSAAVSLKDSDGNIGIAHDGAEVTFNEFVKSGTGNSPLDREIAFADITFEYSKLWAGTYLSTVTEPNFVRVAIDDFGSTVFFGGIFNVSSLNITASAVAGPLTIEPCNLMPIAACAGYEEEGEGDYIVNKDCEAGDAKCFGLPFYDQNAEQTTFKKIGSKNPDYSKKDAADAAVDPDDDITYDTPEFLYDFVEQAICSNANLDADTNLPTGDQDDFCNLQLKNLPGDNSEIGAGNFNLLSLSGDSSSASEIRDNFAGDFDNCNAINDSNEVDTKPGSATGPVWQGINTRFGEYDADLKKDEGYIKYPSDTVTVDTSGGSTQVCDREGGASSSAGYCDYKNHISNKSGYDANDAYQAYAVEGRRKVGVPVIDCDALTNGAGTVKVLGVMCVLIKNEIGSGDKEINTEIIPIEDCPLNGEITETNEYGITRIYLYKDKKNKKDS